MAHRWVIVGVCAMVIASLVPLFRASGINFTPNEDESRFQVSVRLPVGSSLAATTSLMERIARDMREQLPGRLGHAVLPRWRRRRIRTDERRQPVRAAQADRRARVLAAGADRQGARRLIQPYRQSAVISIQSAGGWSRSAAAARRFNARWSGRICRSSINTPSARGSLLSKNETLVDVDRTYLPGRPELRLNIDRRRAGDLGVRVQDVSQTVNALVAGQKVTTFNAASDQYDVVLRAQDSFRRTPDSIAAATVRTGTGELVQLRNLVTFNEGAGPAAIERLNRQRQISISANPAPGGAQAKARAWSRRRSGRSTWSRATRW